jgi:hypothetical protein
MTQGQEGEQRDPTWEERLCQDATSWLTHDPFWAGVKISDLLEDDMCFAFGIQPT